MKVLLVHQNFPGQFLNLAPALATRGHEVTGLTDAGNRRASQVPVLRYRTPEARGEEGLGSTYAKMAARGAVVARAMAQHRRAQGYVPDVILGHDGWGETLFLREVFPEARHIGYAEFLYGTKGLDTGFDREFQSDDLATQISVTARAAHLLQAAMRADLSVAPTDWQAATFPPEIRSRMRVIHDGIATDRIRPDATARVALPSGVTLAAGDEVLSFVSRRLEPYRGYHVFMRALPDVLAARPRAQVVIVGAEGQSYGARPPGDRSWKEMFLDEVRGRIDASRVHFTGSLPYADFLRLMQVTRVHAYLTYPFVLSWSMLEAMAAGALVVGSRTGPVTEVIADGVNGRLVDFFDVGGWSAALAAALEGRPGDDALRAAARRTVVERYDLNTVCLPRWIDLIEGRV
jgi:glycosyltransferase involved in cell wall biosynthesis